MMPERAYACGSFIADVCARTLSAGSGNSGIRICGAEDRFSADDPNASEGTE